MKNKQQEVKRERNKRIREIRAVAAKAFLITGLVALAASQIPLPKLQKKVYDPVLIVNEIQDSGIRAGPPKTKTVVYQGSGKDTSRDLVKVGEFKELIRCPYLNESERPYVEIWSNGSARLYFHGPKGEELNYESLGNGGQFDR